MQKFKNKQEMKVEKNICISSYSLSFVFVMSINRRRLTIDHSLHAHGNCNNRFISLSSNLFCLYNNSADFADYYVLNEAHSKKKSILIKISYFLLFFFSVASLGLFGNGSFVGWTSYAMDNLDQMVSLSI